MGTAAAAGSGPDVEQGRSLSRKAFLLGLASPLLLAAEWVGWIPFAIDLAIPVALVSLVYSVRALRRPRRRSSTAFALAGAFFAFLALLAVLVVILVFVFVPGD